MSRKSKKIEHFVSIIAPIYNNEKDVNKYVSDLSIILKTLYTNYEIIFIDNGSIDKTIPHLTGLLTRYPCIRIIRLSRKYNIETAIFAGLDIAIGDSIVIMLPESDSPRYIPLMVNKLRKGDDVVYAIMKKGHQPPFWERQARAFFFWYAKRVLNVNIPANATHFMALNRRSVNALIQIRSYYRHLRLLCAQIGFITETISYKPKRLSGIVKEEGLMEAINQGLDIIFAYSKYPLRFVSFLGITASIVNLLYVFYILAIFFFKKRVAEGWTTLSLQTAVLFFFVFLLLTVLSEYIGKILEETRDRPSYHIMEELNSKVSVTNKRRRNVIR